MTEANAALLPYVPLVAQLTGLDMTLERIKPLMAGIGNPQNKLKVVHLAGTSGKTSTAYYMAALIKQAGKTVGLCVSPHIDSVRERVQINGAPISEEMFCAKLSEFLEVVEQMPAQPSYFELLYAFAFFVFDSQGVEYAVVETGMGGLHDATNVATKTDKVCIITDLGYDHTHILGNTLSKIAFQKAGIIHAGNHVFMYRQSNEVMKAIEDRVKAQGAHLTVTSEAAEQQTVGETSVMPDFQRHNWLLAYRVYRYLEERDGLPGLSLKKLRITQQLQVPARMEIIAVGDKKIVMDGAHNAQKMETFASSFRHRFPGVRPAVLLAVKQTKETDSLVPIVAGLASEIIVTTFNTSQDMPAVSIDPDELAAQFMAADAKNVQAIANQHQAFEKFLAGREKVGVITGSFYLISQLREKERLI